MPTDLGHAVRVAIVNDYEVVVAGLARMLEPYADRVRVVEIDANAPVASDVDIALFDTFAQGGDDTIDSDDILSTWGAERLVVYTWDADARMLGGADDLGVDAYLTKRLPADDLVSALEEIHDGTWTGTDEADLPDDHVPGDWPGRDVGLSERESEMIALIVQGLSNQAVADRSYVSINTVKSHIRTAYRKMGVATRSQAILWALDNGFRRSRVRITHPNGVG